MVVAAVQGRRVEKYWRCSRGVVSDVGRENGYDGFEVAGEVVIESGFQFVVEAVGFGLLVGQYGCRFEAFVAPGR